MEKVKKQFQTPNQEPTPVTFVPEALKTLFEWKASSRPFKTRSREFYTTAGSIIFLVCIILVFIKEFLFIMAIIAFAFFYYVLSTVKPEEVAHKITNRGIDMAGNFFPWNQLGRFWFDQQWDSQILYIENFVGLPPRLMLLFDKKDKETLKQLLGKYLFNEKPEKSQIEKAGQWLAKKVPLETEPKNISISSSSK